MVKRASRFWNLGKETNRKTQGVVNTYSFLAELFLYIFICSDWYLCWCRLRCRKPRKRQRSWNEQVLSGNRVSSRFCLSKPITHSSEKYFSAHSKKTFLVIILIRPPLASRWAVGRLTLLTTPALLRQGRLEMRLLKEQVSAVYWSGTWFL